VLILVLLVMKKKKKSPSGVNIRNKKAFFSYTILEEYVAGIELRGSEIKSIRNHKASLADAYCYFKNGELWAKGIHISEYQGGQSHDPIRVRKLLIKRQQLRKWEKKKEEKGHTIVVLRLFINEKGLAKLVIALAKGKKQYDKRDAIKSRDLERRLIAMQSNGKW